MTQATSTDSSFARTRLGQMQIPQRYGTLFVLVLVIFGCSVTSDRFLSITNLLNILEQISMLTIVATGLTYAFATREMDLSVGYVVGFAGIVVPLMLVAGWPLWLALSAALLGSFLVGLLNALIVVGIGVPSLIATLAVGSIMYGVNFIISGGRAVYGGLPHEFLVIGQGRVFGIPSPSILMLVIMAISWILLEKTVFGRRLYAVGGNPRAAELSGIRISRYRIVGLVICSVLSAVAGVILAARLGSGQPNAGETYLLDGLAAVFIGMTMIKPGTATILGTFFGALLIGVMNNGLNLAGMDTYIQSVVKGIVIVISVSIVSRTSTLKIL